ncbi:unnamed protein product [Ilex paraguariensis]|uniref:Uncharacterized protein n=1 Tax=Ilex paraguariensis TaxID=185542 RepID=A0ABC8RKM5_9AQUA
MQYEFFISHAWYHGQHASLWIGGEQILGFQLLKLGSLPTLSTSRFMVSPLTFTSANTSRDMCHEEIQKKTGYILMRAEGIYDVDANTSIDQLSEDLRFSISKYWRVHQDDAMVSKDVIRLVPKIMKRKWTSDDETNHDEVPYQEQEEDDGVSDNSVIFKHDNIDDNLNTLQLNYTYALLVLTPP